MTKSEASSVQAWDALAAADNFAATVPDISEQQLKSIATAKAAELLQQPGANALWSAANIPDVKGRKQNLLQGDGPALCATVAPPGQKTIAVVGNGPLTDESRKQIAASDAIVRFNEMNNRWVCVFCRDLCVLCSDGAPSQALGAGSLLGLHLHTYRRKRSSIADMQTA
jgi:hypothetical protein